MIFGDRHRQQPTFAPRLERVEQGKGEGVVDVVADVGVQDHVDRRGEH